MAVICVDLKQPHKILTNVEQWIEAWHNFLTTVALKQVDVNTQNELIKKVEDYVRTFRVPEFDEEGRLLAFSNQEIMEEIPLAEGILEVNYGIPLTIVGTKVD